MIALALAAVIAATPATLPAKLATAHPGDTLRLAAGTYDVVISGRSYAKPLTIDARKATALIRIQSSSGVTVQGGALVPDRVGRALVIDGSQRVQVIGGRVTSATNGVVISRSQDVLVQDVSTRGVAGNGFSVSGSQRVTLLRGSCAAPAPAGDLHPDCVQAWSLPGMVTSDLTVQGFAISGRMQGVFVANPQAYKALGFDRVRVLDNVVSTTDAPNGLMVADCRACELRGNRVSTMAGSRYQTVIRAVESTAINTGNVVAAHLRWREVRD